MKKLSNLKPYKVFEYFEDICSIPHGSHNPDKICDYLTAFAKSRSLDFRVDGANNVVILKKASKGYENSPSVILQGHIDMVCQKTDDSPIDFEKDGLDIYVEDGFVKARGTTLGADNGIAVAMMLSILDDENLMHPKLECVFTSDEEVGMLGALKLDISELESKRMINLDGGGENNVCISCAGGADVRLLCERSPKNVCGTVVTAALCGLPGGHSGVQINSGRKNANFLMSKILKDVYDECPFDIISLNGGNKTNVITPQCTAVLVTQEPTILADALKCRAEEIRAQIKDMNPDMEFKIVTGAEGDYSVFDGGCELVEMLSCAPNGVIAMSCDIEGLVETSANIGIVAVSDTRAEIVISVRSCIKSSIDEIIDNMKDMAKRLGYTHSVSGAYPPWELKKDTELQRIYARCHSMFSDVPAGFSAIHAGLECGIFDSSIDGLDCISIGPNMYAIHSTSERLDIASTQKVYEIISEVLKNCK